MKRKKSVRWIEGGIAILFGVVCVFLVGKYYYNVHISSFKGTARQECIKVLEHELLKRDNMKVSLYSNRSQAVLSKEEMVKDTVELNITGVGKRSYAIPLHRRLNNLEVLPEYRVMQSYILLLSPLSADTLLHSWQKSVPDSGLRLSVRVGVTDFFEKETFSYAGDTVHLADADSLFSCYLGMRSEVEVTGFASYLWYRMFTEDEWYTLFFLFFAVSGLVMVVANFRSVLRWIRIGLHKLFPSWISLPAMETAKEASPVLVVQGLTFCPNNHMLIGENGKTKLNPQMACLFMLFAKAEGHQLPKVDIMEHLWPDGNCTIHSLHSAISRLRKELHACSDVDILDVSVAYKLCRPKEDEIVMPTEQP